MHWLDHAQLPRIEGTVERFLLNSHGELDGLLLADGREVLFPPHLSKAVRSALRPGRPVTINGLALRGAPVIVAAALCADGSAEPIIDEGPDEKHRDKKERRKLKAEGGVVRSLHGPKGEVRGVLLDDGTVVRFGKGHVNEAKKLIAAGKAITVRGQGVALAEGRCIDAKHVELAA